MNICLCDFVHDYIGTGSYTFPLNIGYISSYTKKIFGDEVDISLFKYPNEFLKQIKIIKPDIIGFSHYTWNKDINKKISNYVKQLYPNATIVFGGPNINYTNKSFKKFFDSYVVNFYVCFFGEIPFTFVVNYILNEQKNKEKIPSVVYKKDKEIIDGSSLNYQFNIKEIPSPYLTGTLDSFFDTRLIPIMETSKGCPYQCTFCSQCLASKNKIYFYDLDIVKKELEYISKKVKNTNILLFADSNFGIAKQDIEIAKYVNKMTHLYNYPSKISLTWAKNQPKIYEIAKILDNTEIIASLQSLDAKVLKKVKRKNISLSIYKNITNKVNELQGISGTEVMLGLPDETKESHIKTLKQLFDWNVANIICYNTLILEGSELSIQREKGKFNCTTKFRLIDSSYGLYDGMYSFETEEGIRSTDTITEKEILFFRPIHWLIQFLWSYKFYYNLLSLLKNKGVNPIDVFISIVKNSHTSNTKVNNIFKDFVYEADKEWFKSEEELNNYYTKNFNLLKEGNYGKMNSKYIYRVLLEVKEEFEDYLLKESKKFYDDDSLDDMLRYESNKIIDFRKDNPFEQKKIQSQIFYVPEKQQQAIQKLVKQYYYSNKNTMMRKLSEYMNINDFFYKVKEVV